ncbi:MAG: DUF5320 domain-containing protein [Halanaerobiales bacterium]
MPRGDRTGPNGMGPMTGRGLGYCAGNNRPGYMEPGPGPGFGRGYGRGFGRGFGRGMGYRRFGYYPPQAPANYNPAYNSSVNKEDELNYLKDTAKNLEKELENINERIKELQNEE